MICVYIVNLSRMNLVQDEHKLIAPSIELNDVRNNISQNRVHTGIHKLSYINRKSFDFIYPSYGVDKTKRFIPLLMC